jgi:predicted nucleic acid-binding protein
MNVVLDTNIVLDVLLERAEWLAEADLIWRASSEGSLLSHITASSITDIYYISRRLVGPERARQGVRRCLDRLGIIGVTGELLEAAFALEGRDFEDDLQIACAIDEGLDAIVTRNPGDFADSPIPVLTPAELIDRLSVSLPVRSGPDPDPIDQPTTGPSPGPDQV